MSTAHLADQLRATDAASGFSSVSTILRLLLQSGVLGLGAYLVIKSDVSGGTIIASTIILSRALAPIEAVIQHWKSFVAARQARGRLVELFARLPVEDLPAVALPAPSVCAGWRTASADLSRDEATNETYFTARIELPPDEHRTSLAYL